MKHSLLLVEDDGYISELYAQKFGDEGFDMKVARDGEEALRMLEDVDFKPDAILLDITMPRMDGLEFLKRFHFDVRQNAVCIVVLTNLPAEEQSRAVFELGAEEYLEKFRYTPSEILDKVKEAIIRHQS